MPTCSGAETITGIQTFFQFPAGCFHYFYLVVMFFIWITFTFILFNNERDRKVDADFISSAGVAAIVIDVLTLAGSGVGFIGKDIFIYIVMGSLIPIFLWMLKK